MGKDRIVHFVGFVTELESADFVPLWESYMNQSTVGPVKVTLEEAAQKQKGAFTYISQHECSSADFKFAFLRENSRTSFPERKARVVQAGGYMPVNYQPHRIKVKGEVRVMAFIPLGENDLDFYHQQSFHQLNIYEAYFENCVYSYVMEFFLDKQDAPALLAQLKTRPGLEACIYQDCYVASRSKKVSGSLL